MEWRFQTARNVVVAGFAIETPRLLLNSACPAFPDGLCNSSRLVSKYLMVQLNQAAWGRSATPETRAAVAQLVLDDLQAFDEGWPLPSPVLAAAEPAVPARR